jgi:hypothetical protein
MNVLTGRQGHGGMPLSPSEKVIVSRQTLSWRRKFPGADDWRMAANDLDFLFPTTFTGGQPRFRVVPDLCPSDGRALPRVTALALHQLRLNNVNMLLSDFPAHGLVNLHLYPREICFTGFDAPTRERLQALVQCGSARGFVLGIKHNSWCRNLFGRMLVRVAFAGEPNSGMGRALYR